MSSQKTEKKKLEEIAYASRPLIRHAYDQVLTRAARLVSFSICPILPDLPAIESRQDELAHDDLIAFALHVRRLVETTEIKEKIGNNALAAFMDGKRQQTPIMKVLNIIIHHRRIDILRRKTDFMPAPKDDGESMLEWIKSRREGQLPVIAIRSDRGGLIGFRIDSLVLAVAEGIIAPIVEYCDDRGLYLEDIDLD